MAHPDESGTATPPGRWFPTTHWSVVLSAKAGECSNAELALEKLCRSYWPPLYGYIRREGYGPEDAQDLTQAFFARLLEKDYLRHLQHQRGKFRSFLLTFLKHFLSDERDKASALKRGGGRMILSLDETSAEEQYLNGPIQQLSPDQLFERRWAQTILEQAIRRLREEYAAEGKGALFEQLKDMQPGERGAQTYAEVGVQMGMSESAVKSAVFRLRQRHREVLREEIANTLADPGEIEGEIRHLMKVLSE